MPDLTTATRTSQDTDATCQALKQVLHDHQPELANFLRNVAIGWRFHANGPDPATALDLAAELLTMLDLYVDMVSLAAFINVFFNDTDE